MWKFLRRISLTQWIIIAMILGAFVGKKMTGADPEGLERLLADFESLDGTGI